MQITKTKNGISVTGAQYLPDGTIIPNNYNPALDTTSGLPPEMKLEIQNILIELATRKSIATGDADITNLDFQYPSADIFLKKTGFEDTFNAPKSMRMNFDKFTIPKSMEANFDKFTIPESMEASRRQPLNQPNSKTKSTRRRILNPITGKYYELRQRTTKHGDAGQIKGLWSSKKHKKVR